MQCKMQSKKYYECVKALQAKILWHNAVPITIAHKVDVKHYHILREKHIKAFVVTYSAPKNESYLIVFINLSLI